MVKKVNAIQTIYARDLAKKFDYNAKIDEIGKKNPNHDINITTQESDKLRADNFSASLKPENLESKT